MNLRALLMIFYYSKTACKLQKQLMYTWLNNTESRGSEGMPPENFKN